MNPLAEVAAGAAADRPDEGGAGGGDGADALGDGEVGEDEVVGTRHRHRLHRRRGLRRRPAAVPRRSLAQPDLKHPRALLSLRPSLALFPFFLSSPSSLGSFGPWGFYLSHLGLVYIVFNYRLI